MNRSFPWIEPPGGSPLASRVAAVAVAVAILASLVLAWPAPARAETAAATERNRPTAEAKAEAVEARAQAVRARTQLAMTAATLVVLGVFAAAVRALRVEGLRTEARHAIASFENGVRSVGEQLDGIRTRCPRTFAVETPTRRYEGRTAEAFAGLAAAAETVWFGYVAMRRRAAEARSAVADGGLLATAGAERVPALVTTEPVHVAGTLHVPAPPAGHADGPPPIAPHRPWFPLKVGLSAPAKDIAVRLGAAGAEAGSRAAALERAFAETDGRLTEARAKIDALAKAAAALAAHGVRSETLGAEHARLQAGCETLATLVARDPLAAFDGIDGLRAAAETLSARLSQVAATVNILDAAVGRELEKVLADVAARRAEGHVLREARLDPDAQAEAARRLAASAREAAARGEEAEARALAERARDAVADLGRLVAASVAARTTLAARIATQRERAVYDRTEGEQRRKALREHHADRALEPIEADLEAAATALQAAGRACEEARAAHERGHALEAATILDENDARLAKAERLHERVDQYADELDRKQERARAAVDSAAGDIEDLETLFTEGYEGSDAVRGAIERVRAELAPERARQAEARPDWPERCRAATALADIADGALASARRERATLLATRPELAELPGLLASAGADVKKTLADLRAEHAEAAIAASVAAAGEAEREVEAGDGAVSAAGAAIRERRHLDLPDRVERARKALALARERLAKMRAEGEDLARARDAARAALGSAKGTLDAFEELARGGDAFATDAVAKGFARLRERLDRERARQDGARPHWREARREAEAVAAEAGPLLDRARREKESWRKTQAILPDVERALADARPAVRSSKVRREAQDLLRQGEQALEAAEAERRAPRPDWGSVLDKVQRGARLVAEARERAETDVRAADQADAVIRQSESAIKDVEGATGRTLVEARAELEKAKALHRAGQYEEALRHAQAAGRARPGALPAGRGGGAAASALTAATTRSRR